MDRLPARIAVEDQLREPVAVAQIDEDQAAVVSIGMHPSSKANFRADVRGPKLATGVSSITCCD